MGPTPGPESAKDHRDRLREFGYNDQEARFLCLAATHSGYFTRHQFLRFTRQTKGCLVHRFANKLLTQNHAQVTQCSGGSKVF